MGAFRAAESRADFSHITEQTEAGRHEKWTAGFEQDKETSEQDKETE